MESGNFGGIGTHLRVKSLASGEEQEYAKAMTPLSRRNHLSLLTFTS
jgi:hypothetical protein